MKHIEHRRFLAIEQRAKSGRPSPADEVVWLCRHFRIALGALGPEYIEAPEPEPEPEPKATPATRPTSSVPPA